MIAKARGLCRMSAGGERRREVKGRGGRRGGQRRARVGRRGERDGRRRPWEEKEADGYRRGRAELVKLLPFWVQL